MENTFGYIENNKIFRKGFLNNPDREIGEIRGSEEETILFFENRFKVLEQKVIEIEDQISSNENKGSFLAKLLHLKKTIAEFDGLGDFTGLNQRLTNQEEFLNDLISQNRIKNLEIKQALISELDLLKNHFNLREASEKIREVKAKWVRTGAVAPGIQMEIDDKFKEGLDFFYNREKSFYDDRLKMMNDHVLQYKIFIENAHKLIDNSKEDNFRQIESIKIKWKGLPKIPKKLLTPFQEEFRKIVNVHRRSLPTGHSTAAIVNVEEVKASKLEIIGSLENHLISFNFRELNLEKLKTKWKIIPKVFDKDVKLLDKRAYMLFDMLHELEFIYNLGIKKTSEFEKRSSDYKVGILIKFLKEITSKEKMELDNVQNNTGIIYSHDRKVQEMLSRQVQSKIRRIEIKSGLINDLSDGKIKIAEVK